MTSPVPSTDQPPTFGLDPVVARRFLAFSGGFWQGASRARAWLLTIGLVLALLASTFITVQLNHWNRWFFDALERRDVAQVQQAVLVFLMIVALMAAIGVAIVITRETLQVRWRAWLVENLITAWLADSRYYRLAATGTEPQNPEYRISDDTRWATEMLVDLGIGLLTAFVGGIAFVAILWSVGGAIQIGAFTLPGYMVWLAFAYGIFASALMAWIGRPLVGRVGAKNEAEGHFRFAMMRLRDNAESVALMQGGPAERRIIGKAYHEVVGRWLAVVRSHGHLTWVTNATGPMIPIVPLLFAAPKYLAGDLTLGQVTQLAAAFIQVQMAISWVVDNYSRIAEWYASARRIMELVDASEALAPTAAIPRAAGGAVLALTGAGIASRDGRALVAPIDLAVHAGETVLVQGASSSGKSTLARVVAGLEQPSIGRVARRPGAIAALVPQKPYMPLGTLAGALVYPVPPETVARADIERALVAVGLEGLGADLDKEGRWDQVLSGGERQRLAIARVILHKPDLVVLDDALAALEPATETAMIEALRRSNPQAAILVFAQRPLPAGVSDRAFRLTGAVGASHFEILSDEPATPLSAPART